MALPTIQNINPRKNQRKHSEYKTTTIVSGSKIKSKRVPTLGFIKYKTSNEYTLLLQTSKINNETIKFKNGKYYAIVNVVTDYTPWPL